MPRGIKKGSAKKGSAKKASTSIEDVAKQAVESLQSKRAEQEQGVETAQEGQAQPNARRTLFDGPMRIPFFLMPKDHSRDPGANLEATTKAVTVLCEVLAPLTPAERTQVLRTVKAFFKMPDDDVVSEFYRRFL